MSGQPAPVQSVPSETVVDLGRLKALTDGVVAVALTLLLFEIGVPAGISSSSVDVAPWPATARSRTSARD